ncbi:MAG: hypothetical protein LUF78_03135, partial [Clostridiales bacterium]|nr:hypothetical protein [Clostridiales bacterium]
RICKLQLPVLNVMKKAAGPKRVCRFLWKILILFSPENHPGEPPLSGVSLNDLPASGHILPPAF